MDADAVIDKTDAARAVRALIPIIADMTMAAADQATSPDLRAVAAELARLCRDAATLADAIAVIHRRAGR